MSPFLFLQKDFNPKTKLSKWNTTPNTNLSPELQRKCAIKLRSGWWKMNALKPGSETHFHALIYATFLESHAKKSSIIRQPRPDNNLSWVSRLQALLWFILKIILLITENQNVTSHRTMNYWRQIKLLFSAEETTITPANSSLYASGRRVHVTRFERPKQLSSPLNTTSATCRRKTYLWPFLDENEGINEAYSKWYKHNP